MDKEKTFKIDKETRKLLEQIEKELKESAYKHLFKKMNQKSLKDFIAVEIEDDKPTKS